MKKSTVIFKYYCILIQYMHTVKMRKVKRDRSGERDWRSYNYKGVLRGEFYVNPAFLKTWINEINEMNSGKVGEPYIYPNSLIEFLAVLHTKCFDYRACEGIMRGLFKQLNIPFTAITYTQICRRINALELDFKNDNKNALVAIDGTGMKLTNRGEYIRDKWKVRRGWVKVVIMGSKNGTIDIRVGNEDLDERRSARGMLRKSKNIKKLFMDGLHDARDTFNLLAKKGIEPAIKIRKNASVHARGSLARKKEVKLYKSMTHKDWVTHKDYGQRWPLSEGIISSVKTMFGENLRAHKIKNAYHEARMKFWVYNKLRTEVT